MRTPLVTIITPTYRHEAFIGECIESVIAQTYEDWEQIIVDDCSPDRTAQIAEAYKDNRIRVVRKPRHDGPEGLRLSYNAALKMARGELIAVLEGDDYWARDKLAAQVPHHLDGSIVLSWGGCYEKNGRVLKKAGLGYSRAPKKTSATSALLVHNCIPAVTVLADKSALFRAGGFQQPRTMFVDHPTWLKLSLIGDFLYIPEPLGVYRLHKDQTSRIHGDRMDIHHYSYVSEFISALTPEQKRRVDLRRVRCLLATLGARSNLAGDNYNVFIRQMARILSRAGISNWLICIKALMQREKCKTLLNMDNLAL